MLKKYFVLKNYVDKIKKYIKKGRIELLRIKKNDDFDLKLTDIWEINLSIIDTIKDDELRKYKFFGVDVEINDNINWYKDYVPNYEYPLLRFDKLRTNKLFNRNIDVKFPWEISRFYFGIILAQNYLAQKNEKPYNTFKDLVTNWIEKNPFLYGVNWICPMEAAIRSINWIIAINLFGDAFKEGISFQRVLTKSLVQHAEYISTFPEIYDKGHTTNHTTADYTGLIFLALTLKGHPKSKKWLLQAVIGLERCIVYQTYEDGVNFEASIPYHRLVLELFAYSAIMCLANDIELSKKYYELLFKMFEYTAAYIDHNGNAPQVGDNDSGRILILQETDEHDHSYLLDLGEHIFNYKFKSQCTKRNCVISQYLPEIQKVNINDINVIQRDTDKSIAFEKGGACFLKNDNFSLMLSCFPTGQNGRGGHNHFDVGSFTLSYKGKPIVVDPGTFTYTRDKKERDKFRGYSYHNVACPESMNNIDFTKLGLWETYETARLLNLKFNDNSVEISLLFIQENITVNRQFELFDEFLLIKDYSDAFLKSSIHLSPIVNLSKEINDYKITALPLIIESSVSGSIAKYDYSMNYGSKTKAKKIVFEKSSNTQIFFRIRN